MKITAKDIHQALKESQRSGYDPYVLAPFADDNDYTFVQIDDTFDLDKVAESLNQTRVVNSREELDVLPDRSIVLELNDGVYRKFDGAWNDPDGELGNDYTHEIEFPAQVLYVPQE